MRSIIDPSWTENPGTRAGTDTTDLSRWTDRLASQMGSPSVRVPISGTAVTVSRRLTEALGHRRRGVVLGIAGLVGLDRAGAHPDQRDLGPVLSARLANGRRRCREGHEWRIGGGGDRRLHCSLIGERLDRDRLVNLTLHGEDASRGGGGRRW